MYDVPPELKICAISNITLHEANYTIQCLFVACYYPENITRTLPPAIRRYVYISQYDRYACCA